MNKVDRQAQMMDYLYGEMTDRDRREYELWLDQHPEAKEEIEGLRTSRQWLAEAEDIPSKPLMIDLNPRWGTERKWLYRIASAAAVVLALWLFNFQVRTDRGGLILSFGEPKLEATTVEPEPTNGIPPEVWEKFLTDNRQMLEQRFTQLDATWEDRLSAIRQENRRQWQDVKNLQAGQVSQIREEFTEQELPRLAGLMQQLQIEQQEELQILLIEFWNTWQETRQTDLQQIDYRMTNLYEDVERNQQASEARVVNYIQNVAGK